MVIYCDIVCLGSMRHFESNMLITTKLSIRYPLGHDMNSIGTTDGTLSLLNIVFVLMGCHIQNLKRNLWRKTQCTSSDIIVYSSISSKVNPLPRYQNDPPRTRSSIGEDVDFNHLPKISDESLTVSPISLYSMGELGSSVRISWPSACFR
jgi:hypothetical protein